MRKFVTQVALNLLAIRLVEGIIGFAVKRWERYSA